MNRSRWFHVVSLGVMMSLSSTLTQAAEPKGAAEAAINEMPADYKLQAYDDCGVLDRQPHVRGQQIYMFSPGEVQADERARSVAWDMRQIDVVYERLDPRLNYILAVTYASEPANHRVQSLWAGDTQLHGPHALPRGKAERWLLRVPGAAINEGRLALAFKLEGPVNVVVSALELWAPAPSPVVVHVEAFGVPGQGIEGRVLGLAYEGLKGISVQVHRAGQTQALVTTTSAEDGVFRVGPDELGPPTWAGDLQVTATCDQQTARQVIPTQDLVFEPTRYRPMPAAIAGFSEDQPATDPGFTLSLDGEWRINLDASESVRQAALDAAGWNKIKVPGQWLQQGYDVPMDKKVTMSREFAVPEAWKGLRIILRFESIHAGTHYWLNGKELGYSENLYTPVEWDVTEIVRLGKANRMDLEMQVATISEQLSYASNYAFHNLGGIDRSVRMFALPAVHVRSLHLNTDLDADYRDAQADLEIGLENAGAEPAGGLELQLAMYGADGQPASLTVSRIEIGTLPVGTRLVRMTTRIANPLKWNAEQPNLYRMVLELQRQGQLLERIERQVGFRKIEIRQRQLYVNNQRVKLAGACRHEIDPLTGRADTVGHAEKDVLLIKSANLNYIRTSHYPPTREFLDAADRLGVYVECEAPFCWVNPSWDLKHCRKVLTPTSAMIDYCHIHPSITLWSLANESSFCRFFEVSDNLVRRLDPTRPTTFNNPDPKRICPIANLHYPPMPYDASLKDDPRPILLGEYFFPVCHEQTDVRVNPGLRELWAAGHSDPDSEWGKLCDTHYTGCVGDGARPGAWSYIYHSDTLIGGAIWAAFDEPFYLPGGKNVGYAWVHGYWGLLDGWRRPKPEHWLSKMVFSPVWFPVRQVDFVPGRKEITIPVENRYSFTDLKDLEFSWEFGEKRGRLTMATPAASTGKIVIPQPSEAKEGDAILLQVKKPGPASGSPTADDIITALKIRLGKTAPQVHAKPTAGPPRWEDDGKTILISGDHFSLRVDKTTAELKPVDGKLQTPVLSLPALHVTRYDYGDLAPPGALPYAVLPDEKTRVVEAVTVAERDNAVAVTVKDKYEGFAGAVTWLIDRRAMSTISMDYTYSGPAMAAREVGARLLMAGDCDEIRWRRWSEWDVFPEDSISRTVGTAKARREAKWGPQDAPESARPTWPWSLDQNELGTNDFRAVKFNIYEASLVNAEGKGLRVHANADVHVRPCLAGDGVKLHLLSDCRMGPVKLNPGDRLTGAYSVELLPGGHGR